MKPPGLPRRLTSFKMRILFGAIVCIGVFVTTVISLRFDGYRWKRDTSAQIDQYSVGFEEIADLKTLRLVHVFFRHGDRTPIDRYPKDPYNSRIFWPEGWGRLTRMGKLMQYRLGQYIRLRYDGFLNKTFTPEEIYVQSSDKDRTIMSAMANLAGMFPSSEEDLQYPEGARQQFVPIHSISPALDNKIAFTKTCPKYAKLFKEVHDQPSEMQFNTENADFYKYLSDKTGLDVINYNNVSDIFDILFVQQSHNLKLPEWSKEIFPNKLRTFSERWVKANTFSEEMRRLRMGPLLTEVVKNMKRYVDHRNAEDQQGDTQYNVPPAKFYAYSGHDTTLSALLDALGLYTGKVPPYASSLYFELHKYEKPIGYVVKIFYRSDKDKPAEELLLSKCNNKSCQLDDFIKSAAAYELNEKEWENECKLV